MNQKNQPTSKFLKFLRLPLIRIILGFLTLGIVATIAQAGAEIWIGHATNTTNFLYACIVVVSVSFAYYGFVRFIERRTVTELLFPFAFKELIGGALIGVVLFSITIGVLWLFGFYQVFGVNGWNVIVPGLVLSLFSGVFEELLIRGILFRIMEESLGTWLALMISAAIFGAGHLGNPNATWWGAIAIAIEAGIMLAAAFVFTRRLWLPIGIHFAWNFTQGAIFGVAVSGNEMQGLLRSTLRGPAILSGGAFGAEASIFAVIICFMAGIYFIWMALKKGNFIKPFWTRSASEN